MGPMVSCSVGLPTIIVGIRWEM